MATCIHPTKDKAFVLQYLDEAGTLIARGWHYRGYRTIPLCDQCSEDWRSGRQITIKHKTRRFICGKGMPPKEITHEQAT